MAIEVLEDGKTMEDKELKAVFEASKKLAAELAEILSRKVQQDKLRLDVALSAVVMLLASAATGMGVSADVIKDGFQAAYNDIQRHLGNQN